MDVHSTSRWARVVWHLAGTPETRYVTLAVPLGDDPENDRTKIRAYIAKRHLRITEAAPLVRLDEVAEIAS